MSDTNRYGQALHVLSDLLAANVRELDRKVEESHREEERLQSEGDAGGLKALLEETKRQVAAHRRVTEELRRQKDVITGLWYVGDPPRPRAQSEEFRDLLWLQASGGDAHLHSLMEVLAASDSWWQRRPT